jgi:hypothetical protein
MDGVVGGADSDPGSRSYQVSLQGWSGYHFCGGALIASQWVLTAAHCVARSTPYVRVGVRTRSSSEGEVISVDEVIIHSGFKASTLENDIALLKLASAVDTSLTPLLLPTSTVMSAAAAPGDMVTVSGWGATREGGILVDVLQEVDVPVVSNSSCNASYRSHVADSMICAGYANGGKDSCQGDSGGPLVADLGSNTYSVGVVSWGDGCARPDKPGVHTRTYSFVSWIEEKMGRGDDLVLLDPGVPVHDLAAGAGAWLRYAIDVPEGVSDLMIRLSDGSGDADLYVREGAEPTSSAHDCRPFMFGNGETCAIASPSAGRTYAYLYGYRAFSGVTLTASYETSVGSDVTLLESGVPVTGLSGSMGNWQKFAIDAPAAATTLTVTMSGGIGDADLYARESAEPNSSTYDCRPFMFGNDETCTFEPPAEGRTYIFVYAYKNFADATLVADLATR